MKTPFVFNIQRYALHDGPGVRTTVFLKGCPLKCRWCCNPESQNTQPEIYFESHQCIGCRSCEKSCPYDVKLATRLTQTDICNHCIEKPCLNVCPSGAISVMGKAYTMDELIDQVSRDKVFYQESGGGVTLSGGEPFLYPEFMQEFFHRCHQNRLRTAVETCLHVPWENIEQVVPEVDFIYCDYKHWNKETFHQWTGGDLTIIENNLNRLIKTVSDVTIRVPLIPGFNLSESDVENICINVKTMGYEQISLLPYHRLGMVKYERLGREYTLKDALVPDKAIISDLNRIPEKYGLKII